VLYAGYVAVGYCHTWTFVADTFDTLGAQFVSDKFGAKINNPSQDL